MAPGKHYRKGISLVQLMDLFPTDEVAERWFMDVRWPGGVRCPKCGSHNIQERPTRKPQPYRCRDCRKDFSLKTGTLMQGSPLGYRVWVLALFLYSTNLKSVSSMKLHRDLDVTQKTAWHLAHRIRETWNDNIPLFAGPVEVDETFMGGKRLKYRDLIAD
ncbi:MAG: IS1595 family transposase [Rhodospirillaceae bacterium]|nr:IS1595 family transposase [Rhodospirillaceae bacterium]MCY4309797.1 IS1595 family transposase [Rhodospirillaceae bacterium]